MTLLETVKHYITAARDRELQIVKICPTLSITI
jgi:hypothetical protein